MYASDKASAVAQLLDDGGLRRIGQAGGEPNGISLTADGHFVIANFGLGQLQEVDPVTGDLIVRAADEVEGQPIKWINYPLVDSAGHIWVSVCSIDPDLTRTIGLGTADGFVFRIENQPGAIPEIVAAGVNFPNCMALDRDEEYLYVVRTTLADVVRFPIVDGGLGDLEVYSPSMGERRPDEFGEGALGIYAGDPAVGRRWGMADGYRVRRRRQLVGDARRGSPHRRRHPRPGAAHDHRRSGRSPHQQSDQCRLGRLRHARRVHRLPRHSLRPQRPELGGRDPMVHQR